MYPTSRFAAGALDITGRGGYGDVLEGVGQMAGLTPQQEQYIRQCLCANGGGGGGAQFWMPPVQQPSSNPGLGLAYGGSPRVEDRPLRDFREFPLGFFEEDIAAGDNADVVSRPQVTFRGERLVIPASVGASFALLDIKVGNKSQLVNSVQLPSAVFAENAIGVRLSMDTASIAQDIALQVLNTTASTHDFSAAIVGTAAQ